MNDTTDRIFRDLRPAALDELAEDAHARRRDTDLAHALRAVPAVPAVPARRSRRPVLALAAVTAAAAVTGALVATDGDGPAPGPGTPAPATAQDARTVLLASAHTAERTPVKPGRYWYTRVRTQAVRNERMDRTGLKPGQRSRVVRLPYTYIEAHTQESWLSRTGRDRTRSITGINAKLSFPAATDEAAWRGTGAPQLMDATERRRAVSDHDGPITHTIGNENVPTGRLLKLPTDPAALARELRRRYEADVRDANDGKGVAKGVDPYPYYVWVTAQDLLAGPITSGTRAALYRVLADLPEARGEGRATDQLGRPGVAVTMRGPGDGARLRLIIDPRTANLLAYESGTSPVPAKPALSMAYEAMGWVDSLAARP
ncbi:CU044_5270 family protein [Actinomadura kijaniata]|uniref:CU044_5270 family protein n=1 Tax=Actinomadura kijaniata TaxID=46161 RepID=UPI003F1B89BB